MCHEPLKVLYLINALPQVGPVNVLEAIIRGLDRRYVEPHILVLRCEDPSDHDAVFASLGVSVGYLRCSYWTLELRTARVAARVAQYADRLGCKLLHLHGYHPDLIGGQLSGRFVTVSTQHNISSEDFFYSKGRLIGLYMNVRLRRALSRLTALVGITQHVATFVRSQHPGGEVRTIYNGVDVARFRPVQSSEERTALRQRLLPTLPPDAELWLVCGSLSHLKDPLTAVRAFVQLLSVGQLSERAYLVFLGEGGLRGEIEQMLGEVLADRVLLLGFRSNVQDYMRVANYLIAPSHSEGFGLNVIEAMLSGLVPIVSDIPAHRELLVILPRYEELIFASGDAHALGLSMQKARGLSLSREERASVAEAFSQETMAAMYMDLYARLHAGSSGLGNHYN